MNLLNWDIALSSMKKNYFYILAVAYRFSIVRLPVILNTKIFYSAFSDFQLGNGFSLKCPSHGINIVTFRT